MIIMEYTMHGSRAFGVAFAPQQPMMLGVIVRDAESGHCSLTVAQRPEATIHGFVQYTFRELALDAGTAYALCLRLAPESCSPQDFWARMAAELPPGIGDPIVQCPARPWLPAALGLRTP